MSTPNLEALLQSSRRVLALAVEGDTDALTDALAERRNHLGALSIQMEAGSAPGNEALAELRRLEAETMEHLRRQRDQVGQELLELRRGRTAVAGYRPAPAASEEVSRFLDQSG
jgi:hypothetical protein